MMGCSDNDLNQENGPQIAEKDGQVYMKVSIANPQSTGTRALDEGFENGTDGTENENKIEKIIFAFYNDNGNYVGTSTMTYSANPQGDNEFGDATAGTGTGVEKILTMVVPVDVNAGNAMPTRVVAYVNPVKTDHNAADNLETFGKLTRDATQYKDGAGNFVMNNSVYYAGSTMANGKPIVTVDISEALKPTKTEANAKENDAIEIHVERICAKVQVTKNASNLEMNEGTELDDAIANTDMKIEFHPTGWALNATATSTYLVKQFRSSPDSPSATYNEVNGKFSENKGGWNAHGNFRSYWCTSYGYGFTDYPKYASEANADDCPVHYITYNDVNNANKVWGAHDYCLEHTVQSVGVSPAAYTSVIVAGYYTLDGAAQTFYTFGEAEGSGLPYIYKENETDLPKLIEAMAASTMDIYKKVGDNYEKLTGNELSNVFEVTRPDDLNDKPSRYVYLQLKSDLAVGTCFYEKEGEKVDVTTAEAEVNASLLTGTPATKFVDGAAYYNIPIEHYGKNASNQVIYATYGVVRNHLYKIEVQGISGLGTGVGDKGDVIVPPTEEEKYYVKTQLKVLAWKVASQGVILGE
ncbi:hypothetical protein IMSAGC004_01006 [Bacteroidaceae bacterium]|nr:hypothetical protein IMSAGC004_01006 [Bacteroidaceae bacterium]